MSFATYFFVLVFLPLTVAGYHMINRREHFTLGKCFLLGMSVWFVMTAGWQGTLITLALILLNYAIYRYGYSTRMVKLFMASGIILNILSLAVFKYLGVFMAHDADGNVIAGTDIISSMYNVVNLIIPLGISFITFSQISFLVETGKAALASGVSDEIQAADASDENQAADSSGTISLLDYALFVMYFPKVTMGPIALSVDFIPQLNEAVRKKTDYDNLAKGLVSFTFGLAKKVLLADLLAGYVGYAYDYTPILGATNAWIAVLAYTLQLYFDFSGFCDMANGISLMLNIDLPVNFNSPYRSLSIGEFWDRWHITLTKFFTKYIYIPLGGSRKGTVRTYINILIVFLISGIWHGNTINFVIWGMIHGVCSCISRMIKPVENRVPKFIRWIVTFMIINIAWVFFRAPSLDHAGLMLKEMFGFRFGPVDANFYVQAFPAELEIVPWLLNKFTKVKSTYYFSAVVNVLVVAFGLFASTKMKNTSERLENFKPSKGLLAATVFLLLWSILSMSDVAGFIYVNF